MKKLSALSLLVLLSVHSIFAADFNIKTYKLSNGLNVILNEDHSQTKVFGAVTVNAGSVNDPDDATGMAHYLEHVFFNGTTNLGTINWEAEKIHYDKIIELFEKLRTIEDKDERKAIITEINQESIEQGKYFQTKEFTQLLESIGTSNINAGTNYDMTYFHSVFPPSQSKAWLEIYANEFTNNVFRNFQAELETVYEEYNMRNEDPGQNLLYSTNIKMFEGSPYGRFIGGTSEHLKSPSLKKLIEFFNTWYVPENMSLVLVGDFNSENIKQEIEETFGKWEAKSLKASSNIEKVSLTKKASLKLKVTPYNIGFWCFNAPYLADGDEIKVQLLNEVLSNSASIGVLDQLQTDGDVMYIGSNYSPMKSASMLYIQAVPNFDMSQMRQLSTSEIDDLIFDKITEIKDGKIDDKLLNSVRDNYLRLMAVSLEEYPIRAQYLMNYFITGKNPEELNQYIKQLEEVTVADITEMANKYLNKIYLEVSSTKGEIDMADIEKLDIEPVLQTIEEPSEFAKQIQNEINTDVSSVKYIDFEKDIERADLAEKVKLYYKQNTQNDIFDLTINYKIGTATIPTLSLAAQLMNNAGIRGNYKPHELKKKMGELGCSYFFSANENNLYVSISGREKNLEEACKLISMITLMPDLDIKQYNSLIGSEMNSRNTQKQNFDFLSTAASSYLRYGENSPYIKRLSWNELSAITINSLTADFMKATKYAASVHYVAQAPFEESKERLVNSLAFASGRLDEADYYEREINQPSENTIYLVNKPGTRQSKITIMVPSKESYTINDSAPMRSFSNYFGLGFGNIFTQEIREYRSMAYSANAFIVTPSIPNYPTYLYGMVGTQGDKTNNVIEVVFDVLQNMPLKPAKAEGVKNNLLYGSITSRPSDRYLSQYIETWEKMGYTEDPSKFNKENYELVNMDYINKFYSESIKGKPITVVIVGDKKKIDTKELEKFGNYKYLNSSKLFNE